MPYLNLLQKGGQKERAGNPIFSLKIVALNRAIRIIQVPEGEAPPLYISGYLAIVKVEGEAPTDELVIDLVWSEKSKAIAIQWLEAWLVQQLGHEAMEALINTSALLVVAED